MQLRMCPSMQDQLRLKAHKLTEVNHRPGAVYTPIQADTREAKAMEGWGGKTGLGRPGQPSEVAPTFVFLASPEASLYCKCLARSSSVTGFHINSWNTDGQVMHCYPLGD